MAAPSYTRSLACAAKRLRISCPSPSTHAPYLSSRQLQTQQLPKDVAHDLSQLRLPRAVQATYLAPLKRQAQHHIPTCDLQLRSYSVRNLEVFADFALRAAYFLHLPASGPVPLPRITERWTVPRSNFIFKKSQENFERITLRRLIQIQDGNPEVVSIWLAFLQKYQYFGVGMKANVWDYSGLHVAKALDREADSLRSFDGDFAEKMKLFAAKGGVTKNAEHLEKALLTGEFKGQWGAFGPMSGNDTVPANKGIRQEQVGGE